MIIVVHVSTFSVQRGEQYLSLFKEYSFEPIEGFSELRDGGSVVSRSQSRPIEVVSPIGSRTEEIVSERRGCVIARVVTSDNRWGYDAASVHSLATKRERGFRFAAEATAPPPAQVVEVVSPPPAIVVPEPCLWGVAFVSPVGHTSFLATGPETRIRSTVRLDDVRRFPSRGEAELWIRESRIDPKQVLHSVDIFAIASLAPEDQAELQLGIEFEFAARPGNDPEPKLRIDEAQSIPKKKERPARKPVPSATSAELPGQSMFSFLDDEED